MSKLLTEKQVMEIVRVKLPMIVEAFTAANLEAQSKKPDVTKIRSLLNSDDANELYDVCNLLEAVARLTLRKDQ